MKRKIKKCKWYPICPIKYFAEHNKLDRKWVENYCLIENQDCVRYKLEKAGESHPDNMLPNGEIRDDLSY